MGITKAIRMDTPKKKREKRRTRIYFSVSSPGERVEKRVAVLRPDRSPERRPPEPPPDAGDSESESGRMNYSPSDSIRSAQLYFKRILINVYNK